MCLKIFDSFLANPRDFVLLITKGEQLVDDFKQLLMFFINSFYTNIESFFPYYFIFLTVPPCAML